MRNVDPDRLPTIDEIISTINHSTLPSVFIEGKDDAIVFRDLEDFFSDHFVSIVPLGGRDRVLQLYDRRNEIKSKCNFCFIADLDTWVISGLPTRYVNEKLIFTIGYSIENDIYADGFLENLLSAAEKSRFKAELKSFLEWYALALARHLADDSYAIDFHPNQLLDCPDFYADQTKLQTGESYPNQLFSDLHANYVSLLRGKSLFGLIFRQLCSKTRPVKHKKESIIEMVARLNGPLISRFYDEVQRGLGLPDGTSIT